jgi:plastocyanin
MRGLRVAGRILVALCIASATVSSAETTGRVRGRVTLELPGARLADVAPVVVFLDGVDGSLAVPPSREQPAVHQVDARFSPSFVAIAVGTTVQMPNDDAIYHNVFSYSRPNDFDLGLYPAGQSRSVTFKHAGVVKTYCSIHESMNGTIYVAPSPFFAMAGPAGAFEITGVPAGRYKLRTWCEKLPGTEREIVLKPGEALTLDVPLISSRP